MILIKNEKTRLDPDPHHLVSVGRGADEVPARAQRLARIEQHRARLRRALKRIVQRKLTAHQVKLHRRVLVHVSQADLGPTNMVETNGHVP